MDWFESIGNNRGTNSTITNLNPINIPLNAKECQIDAITEDVSANYLLAFLTHF